MGLNTKDVLDAASTKWNFQKYAPGLVGGHCIPVDPYYLVYKAKELGYHPQVILAGRAINDYKLFCTQKPLLNCLRHFCFAKRNISLVKLSFKKKGLQ